MAKGRQNKPKRRASIKSMASPAAIPVGGGAAQDYQTTSPASFPDDLPPYGDSDASEGSPNGLKRGGVVRFSDRDRSAVNHGRPVPKRAKARDASVHLETDLDRH